MVQDIQILMQSNLKNVAVNEPCLDLRLLKIIITYFSSGYVN